MVVSYKKLLQLISIITILASLSACSVQAPEVKMVSGRPQASNMSSNLDRNIRELAGALMQLGPNVSRDEAFLVAHDAYTYPMYLTKEWNVTWPPMYHNALRNAKVKRKGLCTDWANAMVTHMRKRGIQTMDIYWMVAFKGDPWREHSTLLMTAKGAHHSTGIILDPWRHSGKLFWLRHVTDPVYHWEYYLGPFGPLPEHVTSSVDWLE